MVITLVFWLYYLLVLEEYLSAGASSLACGAVTGPSIFMPCQDMCSLFENPPANCQIVRDTRSITLSGSRGMTKLKFHQRVLPQSLDEDLCNMLPHLSLGSSISLFK